MTNWSIVVKPTGRTFGVFGRVPGKPDELLEGGFFGPASANVARARWERECLSDEVACAEQKAGWDPKP